MKNFKLGTFLGWFIALWLPQSGFAQGFESVALSPVSHLDARLTVIDKAGVQHVYTPQEIEEFPTYRITTTTPWRDDPATFDGVMLSDVLASHELGDAAAIQVTAENDYISMIPRPVWDANAIQIATRVDGAAISRPARGPFLFVTPASMLADGRDVAPHHLVWMARRIELAK